MEAGSRRKKSSAGQDIAIPEPEENFFLKAGVVSNLDS